MPKSLFDNNGRWYKGNYHTHTTLSDGAVSPLEQIQAYKDHGYDFLSFTDHNVMNLDDDWSTKDFLMIPGWERDILYEAKVKCTHVVGLFPDGTPAGRVFLPAVKKGEMTDQELVDSMREKNEFVSLAHPSWSRMEPEEIRAIHNLDAVEVFNLGTECLCHEGHAEWVWDMLLREGRRIWGVACDDTHSHTPRDDRFGGWIMVNAPALTVKDILSSMKKGNFYSSMGPTIKDWGIEDDGSFYIETSPVDEVHFITWPTRGKANFGSGLEKATFKPSGKEKYIRVEVIDSKGNRAYTNPYWF